MCKFNSFLMLILISISFLAVSCVDGDYDLSEKIDLTINVGGKEFVIPGGSTESLTLKTIFKLKEGDVVQADAQGDYFLWQKGEDIKAAEVKIPSTHIAPVTITPVQASLGAFNDVNIPSTPVSIDQTISIAQMASLLDVTQSGLPSELIDLEQVEVGSRFTVTLTTTGIVSNRGKITPKELILHFPSYLKSPDLDAEGRYLIPATENLLDGYSKTFVVTSIEGFGVNESNKKLLYNHQQIEIRGEFSLEGNLNLSVPKGSSLRIDHPQIKLSMAMTAIDINKVTGTVNPEVALDEQKIEIGDLPDFLNDDAVRLDVVNPMINFELNNNTPIDVAVEGTLTARKNGTDLARVNLPKTTLYKNKQNKLVYSRQAIRQEGYTNVVVPDLNNLIETIPDEIILQTKTDGSSRTTVELGRTYSVKPSYDIQVPLMFGEKLQIVYNDTINGWKKNLEDYEITELRAKATVENTTPLSLHLTALAVGEKKADGTLPQLSDIVLKVDNDQVIAPGQSTDINITVTAKVKAMKALDGILLKVTANNPSVGKQLNENQTIRFKDVKLTIKGGITADLN